MSTNVDHVECLSGELTISEEGKAWLARAAEGEVDDNTPECLPDVETKDGRETVYMTWSGEGSGSAVDRGALKKFFSFTRGTAEFVFYWEGGYFATGYRVVDGVMTEHEVEVKLGPPVKSSS